AGGDDAAGAFNRVVSPVIHPRLAQDLAAEAALPAGDSAVPTVLGELAVLGELKSVRGGAQAADRFAGVDVVDEILHLLRRGAAKTGEHDHQIRVLKGLHVGDVGVQVRIDH